MKRLFLFGVAINEYPDPRHCLAGCVDDLNDLFTFLKERYRGRFDQILEQKLTDKAATREAIVCGFDFFRQAKDGDTCLFYYGGHGSKVAAHSAFLHLEFNKRQQTLVCYDSRTKDGRDLLDKELSCLIWSVTAKEQKDVHFVAIMDCCFAGNVTREQFECGVRKRMLSPDDALVDPEDYYGYEYFRREENGTLTPPYGKHVLLAAAKSTQTAKEFQVSPARASGAFTFALIESLKLGGPQLSYEQLMNRVEMKVSNLTYDQSPHLEALFEADKKLSFLGGPPNEGERIYWMRYDPSQWEWVIDAGEMLGMTKGEESEPTLLSVLEDNTVLKVVFVMPHQSIVENPRATEHDKKQIYQARLLKMAIPPLKICIAKDAEAAGKQAFLEELNAETLPDIAIAKPGETARYMIHAGDGRLWLSQPTDRRPLFKYSDDYGKEAVNEFVRRLSAVVEWRKLLDLASPEREYPIRETEFSVEIYRITEIGEYTNTAQAEKCDWRVPLFLQMHHQYGGWVRPAFRMKIRNLGWRKLRVSVVYMEDNFGITNELKPAEELEPGNELYLLQNHNAYPTNAIQVLFPQELHQWGITRVEEYLKVIISTENTSTYDFNQDGLPYAKPLKDAKYRHSLSNSYPPAWHTFLIRLQIHQPLTPQTLQPMQEVRCLNVGLITPQGFTAQYALENYEDAVRDLEHPPCGVRYPSYDYFRPYGLGPGYNQSPPLSVILLYDNRNEDRISKQHPLQMHFHDLSPSDPLPEPHHYDLENDLFIKLPHSWDGAIMHLHQLPAAVERARDPFRKVIRIFLHDPE